MKESICFSLPLMVRKSVAIATVDMVSTRLIDGEKGHRVIN